MQRIEIIAKFMHKYKNFTVCTYLDYTLWCTNIYEFAYICIYTIYNICIYREAIFVMHACKTLCISLSCPYIYQIHLSARESSNCLPSSNGHVILWLHIVCWSLAWLSLVLLAISFSLTCIIATYRCLSFVPDPFITLLDVSG